ncbi:GntP family permease [Salinisphaera sp. Q1T1-3]|uniref:GntP family permease n=1 Tax=Salinisphaera sp. Q1T1-3 TaxID=2321229 RepID=UPI000E73BA2A|nr:GntP family permease [Salinisphaera sp. Q1T1-3]RJS93279.1 GntP family permease [Salinisphaera sp. Q1T1-3]
MDEWTQTLTTGPLLMIAAAAVALLLLLIIRFRVHAFVALTMISLATAFATRIPPDQIVPVLLSGFGDTLSKVALLVGFGAMLGKLVEQSGGAQMLADRMVALFGERRAPFALGLASLFMGFPIFFDAGLVVMLPIIFAVARRLDGPLLLYGLPAAAAFSVMHVFVPPHPGPVSAIDFYNASPGLVLATGVVLAFPMWLISGYLWARIAAGRHPFRVAADLFGEADREAIENPPSLRTVLGLLLIPLVLIFANTALDFGANLGWFDENATWFKLVQLFGNTPVALLISVLAATYMLGWRRGRRPADIERILDSSLPSICSVVLITGAGGMFGGVLKASGIGDALSHSLDDIGLPVIVAVYVVAVALRLAQGSATVALVTASGLMAPAVISGDYSAMQVVAVVFASAAGSVFAGHVNDSGFWLVGRLMGMDVATTLKTWTVQQALESLVGFAMACGLFLLFY